MRMFIQLLLELNHWTKRIADGIRETGKEVTEFSIGRKVILKL